MFINILENYGYMFGFIWGLKTAAMFDVWTFEHILSGLSVGHLVKKNTRNHVKNISLIKIFESHPSVIRFDIIAVLFLAYLWETVEHYLETGLAGAGVEFWFQGVEMWANRMIADPLMMVLGYYIALKNPKWIVPARVLSALWLLVHVFIFPHSMYLHSLF